MMVMPPAATDVVKGPQYPTGLPEQPFHMNANFASEPVLDDESREAIWANVVEEKQPIKLVSAKYGVDVRRVAAVVRLKQVEKNWVEQVGTRLLLRFFFFFCFSFPKFLFFQKLYK